MPTSAEIRTSLNEAIAQEVAERLRLHQARVAAIKATRVGGAVEPMVGGTAASPLCLLANGDSWFEYPLVGNGPILEHTDIIAQLEQMGTVNPLVANVAHHGDATTDELSLAKQQRMIAALKDPANWLTGKPDAVLFSGGGNDIVGDRFCIWLNYKGSGGPGLDPLRFQGVLDAIKASYLDLCLFRDHHLPGTPIFGHCYDFAFPNGVHPPCAGPWLKPSLDFAGWSQAEGPPIVKQSLVAFRSMLLGLANNPLNNFVLVDTQGTLAPGQWANELHPTPQGFQAIAGLFVSALRTRFPNRI